MAISDPPTQEVLLKAYKEISFSKSYECLDEGELNILKRFGFEISGDRVSLGEGTELLDADQISTHLSDDLRGTLRSIEILPCTDSTNDRMQERAREMSIDGHIMMAEVQTAGRGSTRSKVGNSFWQDDCSNTRCQHRPARVCRFMLESGCRYRCRRGPHFRRCYGCETQVAERCAN